MRCKRTGKICYRNVAAALQDLRGLKLKQEAEKGTPWEDARSLRVFTCTACHRLHIGHYTAREVRI